MPTISRRWPSTAPRGDFPVECDVCGVPWRRSQMERKPDGTLCCPDDAPGRDTVTLSEGNAAAAASMHGPLPKPDGGSLHRSNDVMDPDIAEVIGGVTFGNGDGH